jgi:hypothetical protein
MHSRKSSPPKIPKDQGNVWESVAEVQTLGSVLEKEVHAARSPTSYLLSVEDEDLQECKGSYRRHLGESHPGGARRRGLFWPQAAETFNRRSFPNSREWLELLRRDGTLKHLNKGDAALHIQH